MKYVLGWRNWQTRMVEVHMEQSLGVQVPLRVPFFETIQVAYIAQSVEHILGKDEVSGSSPDVGSSFFGMVFRNELCPLEQEG